MSVVRLRENVPIADRADRSCIACCRLATGKRSAERERAALHISIFSVVDAVADADRDRFVDLLRRAVCHFSGPARHERQIVCCAAGE